jgi:hypothetical protein
MNPIETTVSPHRIKEKKDEIKIICLKKYLKHYHKYLVSDGNRNKKPYNFSILFILVERESTG